MIKKDLRGEPTSDNRQEIVIYTSIEEALIFSLKMRAFSCLIGNYFPLILFKSTTKQMKTEETKNDIKLNISLHPDCTSLIKENSYLSYSNTPNEDLKSFKLNEISIVNNSETITKALLLFMPFEMRLFK